MKRRLTLMLVLCMAGSQIAINAQNRNNEGEQMKSKPTPEEMRERKAHKIAMDLALDDATTAKFVDVYQQWLKDKDDVKKEFMPKDGKKGNAYRTDAEVEARIMAGFDRRQKMLDLQRMYYDKFRKVLGPKQIQKMYGIERQQPPKKQPRVGNQQRPQPGNGRPQGAGQPEQGRR